MHKIWWKNYPQTPLLRNWNWAYLWINSLKFSKVCFNCMPSWRLSKYIEGKLQTLCFWLIESFLRKTKAGLELVFLPNFLHDFSRKVFPLLYFINCLNFIAWLLLFREILSNICIATDCEPGCDVINFEINLMSGRFFIWEEKQLLRWNKKHFSSFLKGFHWSK